MQYTTPTNSKLGGLSVDGVSKGSQVTDLERLMQVNIFFTQMPFLKKLSLVRFNLARMHDDRISILYTDRSENSLDRAKLDSQMDSGFLFVLLISSKGVE